VIPFNGRGTAPRLAQRQVHNALDGQVNLVPLDDVATAVERVGDEPRQVAEELNADMIISGNVRGRGRRARTTIIVYDNRGRVIARQTARGRGQTGSAAQEALGIALGVLEERGAPEPEPEPEQGPEPDPLDGMGGDDEVPEDIGDLDDEGPPGEGPLVVITGGVTIRSRDAEVCLAPGGCADSTSERRFYDSGFYPEISLRIEAMPLVRGTGVGKGLLLRGEFAFASWIQSQEEGAMGMVMPLDTSSMRLSLDGGLLFDVGETVKVGGLIGFGLDSFSVQTNNVMPGRSYTYIRLAPMLRAQLSGPTLHLDVEAGLRIGVGTGDLKDDWAASASAFGLEIGAGLGGRLESGLSYGFRAGWVRYGLSFEGMGSPMSTVQAVDGADSGFFFTLHGGWSF
jgi:hypothetical protein